MLDSQAPLDHAKRNMMGSARVVVAANLLFVPFAAMMLVKHLSLMRTFVVYSFSSFHNEFENGNLIMIDHHYALKVMYDKAVNKLVTPFIRPALSTEA